MRLIRDGEKGDGGEGYGGGGRGRLYAYHYTVTTRMTPASRWAVMRAILMFHNCEGQSQDSVHRPQLLKRKESWSRGPFPYQPNALPLGQTSSQTIIHIVGVLYMQQYSMFCEFLLLFIYSFCMAYKFHFVHGLLKCLPNSTELRSNKLAFFKCVLSSE